MVKIVEYLNNQNEFVTQQQAEQLEDFEKRTLINNRLKEVQVYWDNEVAFTYIYLYPDEDLYAELQQIDSGLTYTIAKDMEVINGYTVWNYYQYKNGILDNLASSIKVFDFLNRKIAEKYYVDGNIYQVNKIYHLEGLHVFNIQEELDFFYQKGDTISFEFENGILQIKVSFNPADGIFNDVGLFYGTYEDRLPFMTPDILAYFTNIEPLVPNVKLYT